MSNNWGAFQSKVNPVECMCDLTFSPKKEGLIWDMAVVAVEAVALVADSHYLIIVGASCSGFGC